jgi:hypothetical protein
MSRHVSAAARWKSPSYRVLSEIKTYNRARTYVQTKNKKQKFIVSLGERKQKLSSKDLIFDGGHELLHLPDFTGSLILTRLPSSLTLRYQRYDTTYYDEKMGAYKYLEEIWRKKQSDVLRFLLRVR